MISPAGNFKLYLASKPVDFRKGMDGLAAIVMNEFDLDPFSGAIFIFRSKRADRMKVIVTIGLGGSSCDVPAHTAAAIQQVKTRP